MEEAHSTCFQKKARNGGKGYPEPLIMPPSTAHTHTVILLHGRGSNATRFGFEFLDSKTFNGKSLRELFPSVKFIFPTAKRRRSAVLKRAMIHQWFDHYSLEDPTERQELQYEGLKETTEFIHKLIRKEGASLVGGVGNVIIGGLSQGSAMALIVYLSFTESIGHSEHFAAISGTTSGGKALKQSLGGFIGMSGWLPFAQDIVLAAAPNLQCDDEDYNDPFIRVVTRSSEVKAEMLEADESIPTRQLRAANFVRDLVDLGPIQQAFGGQEKENYMSKAQLYKIPCFLGHGTADEKVSVGLGVQSRDTLLQLGQDVTWKQYDGCGHWYKVPDELDDIACFLREKVGLT